MPANDLILYTKVENLLYRMYPTFRNYPKAETQSLCFMIKHAFVDLMKSISLANSVKSKRLVYLQEADGIFEMLRSLIKLSRNMKYISKGFFEIVDESLSEIKALLIGYLKSSINPNRQSHFGKDNG